MGRRKKQIIVEVERGRFSKEELDNKVFKKRILTGKEVIERHEKAVSLVQIAVSSLNRLVEYFSQTKCLLFLSDEEGCLIYVAGSENLLKSAKENYLIPGAYPDEDSIVAKTIGVAIIDAKSIRVDGKSFLGNAKTNWSAVGSPIRNAEGETISSIVLVSESSSITDQSILLLDLVANSIEQNIMFVKKEFDNKVVNNYHSAVFNQHPFANLTIDNEGIITNISRQAAVFFGVLEQELIGTKVTHILPNWGDFWLKVKQGGKIENINIDLANIPINAGYLLSIAPVILPDGQIDGAILAFRDLKKVNNVVNRFTGNWASYTFEDLIGVSIPFKKTVEAAKKIATETTPVLITGEVGIGKEVFAQSIHNASSRSDCGFVKINLQSIPQNEMECELFGFEEGAFPGIKRTAQPGKIELAHGGTLYIDEVSLLPMALQDKLLAAIRKGVITRVGSSKVIKVDVRVIAATSKDLRSIIQEGKFKLDLFYILTESSINIPPLRERKHDVPLFIKHYLQVKAREQGKEEPVLPKKIVRILARYEWPQNVREIAKFIDFVVSVDGKIGHDVKNEREFKKKYLFIQQREAVDSIRTIEDIEHEAIINALRIMKGNMSKAARKLGVSRNTLYLKCKRYGIDF